MSSGLALTTDGERLTLQTLDPRGRGMLGTFDSVAAAWAALDQLDLLDVGVEQQLAA